MQFPPHLRFFLATKASALTWWLASQGGVLGTLRTPALGYASLRAWLRFAALSARWAVPVPGDSLFPLVQAAQVVIWQFFGHALPPEEVRGAVNTIPLHQP